MDCKKVCRAEPDVVFSKDLAAAATGALKAQSAPAKARIKIDTERVIGDIDPKIYGNFVEHLGRCIQGGVFDEGAPLADANGFRRDEASRKLGVTLLRWPGGNFSSKLPLDGRHWPTRSACPAPADGMGHGGGQPLRNARIRAVCRNAGCRALFLREPGRRIFAGGAEVAGML